MKLYDTFAETLFEFVPASQTVGMYVCGITPYDAAHLGHIFTFHTYDLIQRRLEDCGFTVKLVRNVTDVDEPIYKRAARNGELYTALAARETSEFQAIMQQLHMRPAYAEPLASRYIEPMATAVKRLVDQGFAYKVDDDLYFDTAKDQEFLAHTPLPPKVIDGLFHKRGGDPARPGKRQPLDFLLWKQVSDPADTAAWDTVLGRGRPGWHIECSVMSSENLDLPMDLHGGGTDLVFPHHTCEIAQSRALQIPSFSRHWVHVSPLLLYGEKMSKSLGNLLFAKDLLATASPLAMLPYHYRSGGEWRHETWEAAIALAGQVEERLHRTKDDGQHTLLDAVRAHLDNNLDTPAIYQAIAAHTAARKSSSDLRSSLQLIGAIE